MSNDEVIEKFKQYPFASITTILTVLLIVLLYFRGMGFPDLEARVDQLESEWETIEENVFKNSVNLEEHLATINSISEDIEHRFINRAELASNYRHLYRIESATGVNIRSLEQQAEGRGAGRRGRGDDDDAPPLFSRVPFDVTVDGSYSQVLAFIHALENGEPICRLRTVTLLRSGENERQIAATINFEFAGQP